MTAKELIYISEKELLTEVKDGLNVSGAQFDKTLNIYITDIKGYLRNAGVLEVVINSDFAVGCIARGVADLWNYGNGDTKLSEYFLQRAEQLRRIEAEVSTNV